MLVQKPSRTPRRSRTVDPPIGPSVVSAAATLTAFTHSLASVPLALALATQLRCSPPLLGQYCFYGPPGHCSSSVPTIAGLLACRRSCMHAMHGELSTRSSSGDPHSLTPADRQAAATLTDLSAGTRSSHPPVGHHRTCSTLPRPSTIGATGHSWHIVHAVHT